MQNELIFNKAAETAIIQMADVLKQKKAIEKSEAELKAKLKELMDKYDVKNITTPCLKITSIGESESTSIDLKAFEKAEPVEYAQLLEDYPKTTKRAGYIKFELVKGNG